jgi:3-hydroxy-9,10-secoandrosta-1,3,5(10)-triene-9,17-dione monooxygenase reductase component
MVVEATRKEPEPANGGFDAAEFRRALGSFATGVTIITTLDREGAPLGLTVNSFNSVSLNPPLVLWSLSSGSRSLDAFRNCEYWAVHILATHQEALSGRFAKSGTDKFSGVTIDEGIGGIPLLHDCTARFQCRTAFQYEGGDHIIFVGEVLDFDWTETAPLVFHAGRYAHATRRDPPNLPPPRSVEIAGSFSENFLGYQLGCAHLRFYDRIRPVLVQEQRSDEQFLVLAALTLSESGEAAGGRSALAEVVDENRHAALAGLVGKRLVRPIAGSQGGPADHELTELGAACAVRVISAAKAVELDVLEQLGSGDAPALKLLLNRLLTVIDASAKS